MNKPLFFLGILLLSVFDARAKISPNVAPSLVADFTSDVTVVCAGDSVHFFDQTTENPDGWTWDFDGGTPNGSILQNPVITYNTPGVYTVHLKSNNSEEGDEEIKVEYIKVLFTPSSTFNITSATSQCNNNNSFSFVNTGSSGTHFWGFSGAAPINSSAVNPSGVVFTGPGTHTVSHKVTDDGCSSTTIQSITIFSSPTALAVTSTSSNCAGSTGTITIGATTNGTAPFTYSVNGSGFTSTTSYTGFAPGTYSITVKDANGCTFTRTVTVGSSGGPTAIGMIVTPATCSTANGIVTITSVTGGVSPYTYSVDNSPFTFAQSYSSLTIGIHSVRAKDGNGCIVTQNINVLNTQPTAVVTNTTPTGCASPNGTITLGAVTGGRSPYTFSVDGSAFTTTTNYTGLAAGTHTIVVKDQTGCSLTTTTSITVTPSPTAIAITTSASACSVSTGTITLGAVTGGTAPYTYSIDGSLFTTTTNYTGLAGGTHVIVVKDANGCTFTTSATIANTQPTAASITTTPSSCGSTGTIAIGAVTGGVSPFTYSVNNGAFTTVTTYNNRPAGTYTVSVKDFNGCVLTQTVTITNTSPTALAVTSTTTPCGASNGTVSIGAVTGGVSPFTYSFNGSAFTGTTNYTGLAAGVYTLIVKDANACTFTVSVTVVSDAGPTGLSVTNTGTTCGSANGTITVGTATGGTAPFTYSVDNGAFTSATTFSNILFGTHSVRVKDANGCIFPVTTTLTNAAGPTDVVLTSTNATCGNVNGTITIGAVTGGTLPFTYSLNGSAFTTTTSYTGLPAATYTVTVRDANNCLYSETRSLSSSAGPSAINFNFRHTGCTTAPNTGFVTVTGVVGGTSPFTYSFNGSAFTSATSYSNLVVGTYTLIAKDANGCTVSQTITIIDVPNGPSNFTSSEVDPGCGLSNGSVVVTGVTGGTAPLQYRLGVGSSFTSSNTFTGLAAGSYPLNIRDNNGCETAFVGAVLSSPGGPSGLSHSFTNSTCNLPNGTITINSVTGGVPPYQYSLNGGTFQGSSTFTGVAAGVSMPLVIRDANGCTFTTHVGTNNTGTAVPTPFITQNGFLLTSSGSTGNQWFFNGVAIAGSTAQTHFAQFNGTYTVVRTSGGCTSAPSNAIVITNQSSRFGGNNHPDTVGRAENNEVLAESVFAVPENTGTHALSAYPNPNGGTFTLSFNASEKTVYTIEVLNLFGQVVFAEQVSNLSGTYTKQLDLSEFGAGIYTVVLSDSETRTVQKVITY